MLHYGILHFYQTWANGPGTQAQWAQMSRDPSTMGPNGPGPGPNGAKWARNLAQWIQIGWDPGPNDPVPTMEGDAERAKYLEPGTRLNHPYYYRLNGVWC